jgi:hypothetical protein
MTKDSTSPAVVLDRKGVQIPWKFIFFALAVLGGGGIGSWGLQTFLGTSASASELQMVSSRNDSEHSEIKGTLVVQQKVTAENTTAIKGVTETVQKIESAQTRDIARAEARRLTDDIPNRKVAEREYERLFERNLQRMARGLDPCGSLACE